MKKIILVATIGVLGLVACQKKDDQSQPVTFDQRVPEKLTFVEPTKGQMPSQAQLDEVKATFQTKSKMILPPGELVFPNEKMTMAEIRQREAKLKKNDANSYNMLKEIHAKCKPTKSKMDTNFPSENLNQKLKVGDVFSLDGIWSLTAVSNDCPATADGSATMKLVVEDYDQGKKTMGASLNGKSKLQILIKKKEYQDLLNSRGLIVDTEMTYMMSFVDLSGKLYASAALSGGYLTLTKQVDYTSTFEMVSQSNDKGNGKSELIIKAVMKYPSFQIDVVTYQVQEGERIVEQRMYLNGNKLDSGQQKNIFNNETPGLGVVQHSQVLKALR
ncbi:MAG: hypothetical protein JNL11_16645 [Bdellovibrionaceae bacterium]|nr:hypothetical protein [Pseudobdellovibrionaceae bacterium]